MYCMCRNLNMSIWLSILLCISGRKLDGQLGMVIVHVCVTACLEGISSVGGWWVVVGSLLSFFRRKDRKLAGLKSPFTHLVL